jgi:hypothetical protein
LPANRAFSKSSASTEAPKHAYSLPSCAFNKVLDQQWDVIAMVTQRGEGDGENIQPV